jgi:transcriptional regulator with PAS, ATPase and Fis domain
MLNKITTFIKYLLGKSSELKDLETKDALLAKVVLDIHRKRTHSEFISVPLFALKQIHAIDRENAVAATNERIEKLETAKQALLQHKHLSHAVLAEYLPSVSAIKVVKQSDDAYVAYEGNGRLVALQQVFHPDDLITVEVEEYIFNKPAKILKRIAKVRTLNGLED